MLSCFILQLSVGILRPLPNQTMTATLTKLDALGASQLRTSLQLISFWHPCNSLAPKATCCANCANCCATPNSDLPPNMFRSLFQQFVSTKLGAVQTSLASCEATNAISMPWQSLAWSFGVPQQILTWKPLIPSHLWNLPAQQLP